MKRRLRKSKRSLPTLAKSMEQADRNHGGRWSGKGTRNQFGTRLAARGTPSKWFSGSKSGASNAKENPQNTGADRASTPGTTRAFRPT